MRFNLIFTDFDGTLIKNNIEREFLLFLFREEKSLFASVVLNSVVHFILKFFKKTLCGKKFDTKYFYRGIERTLLREKVDLFYIKTKDNMLWNSSIISGIDKYNDILIILTTSPEFISKIFLKDTFKECKWLLYGTKLNVKDGCFSGEIEVKMENQTKKRVCKSLILSQSHKNIKSVGYGNSNGDLGFLEIVDSAFSVESPLRIKNKKITLIKNKWIKIDNV